VQGEKIGRASTLTWLWTLGAYELIRTMSQASVCFSSDIFDQIQELKQELAIARMPSAKMEKKGEKVPVSSNRSPDGWDIEARDLILGDPEGQYLLARMIFKKYENVMFSIKPSDIIKHHQESYIKA
jgi:hypothetical protein